MKPSTIWSLPVYPVLRDQSHWKCVNTSLKKQHTNIIQIVWIVKNYKKLPKDQKVEISE